MVRCEICNSDNIQFIATSVSRGFGEVIQKFFCNSCRRKFEIVKKF